LKIVCACLPTSSSSASIFQLPDFCLPSTSSILLEVSTGISSCQDQL
jgi:hypothetical protein